MMCCGSNHEWCTCLVTWQALERWNRPEKGQYCLITLKARIENYLQAGRANDNDGLLLSTFLGHFDGAKLNEVWCMWFFYGV